jgi:hypothetical protein
MGRAPSPVVPEGRRVVWRKADEWCGPKCNFWKEPYREGLSRLYFRRRCRRSRKEDRCPQQGGVAEVQLLEETVSRRRVTPRFPP